MTLPHDWQRGSVAGLIEGIDSGKNLRCEERPPALGETGIVKISAVTWGAFDATKSKTVVSGTRLPDSTRIKPGDLLISRANTLELVGATVLVEEVPGNLHLSDKVLRLRAKPGWAKWLNIFLNSADGRSEIESRATGNQLSMRNIGQDAIRNIAVPIPPLSEQCRIVARIEALFARTRRARADLECIAPLAQQYVEAETDKAFAPSPDGGWHMTTAGALADIKSGVTLGKRHLYKIELVERSYLRVANVQRGHLKLDEIKTIRVTRADAARLELQIGDVLMNEGGDRDKLGRGWVWEGQIEGCIHQNHVFRLRLRSENITPRFLSRYANHVGARYFLDQGKQTTNLASISMAKVAALPVPMPPPGQASVVDLRLDYVEQAAARLRGEAIRALALIDRLERNILTRAFRGELIEQDPGGGLSGADGSCSDVNRARQRSRAA